MSTHSPLLSAEHMTVQANIAGVEAKRVQEAVKKVRPSKKVLRQLRKGNLAGVMTGKES